MAVVIDLGRADGSLQGRTGPRGLWPMPETETGLAPVPLPGMARRPSLRGQRLASEMGVVVDASRGVEDGRQKRAAWADGTPWRDSGSKSANQVQRGYIWSRGRVLL